MNHFHFPLLTMSVLNELAEILDFESLIIPIMHLVLARVPDVPCDRFLERPSCKQYSWRN
jgi:hypothetical protein